MLDFSRKEVIYYIFNLMDRVLGSAPISCIKWDINRYITECCSVNGDVEEQGIHAFFKQHRKLFQYGTFYRLKSPFEGNDSAWMTMSKDRKEVMVGCYRMHSVPNGPWTRVRLAGLELHEKYMLSGRSERCYYGSELMNAGIIIYPEDLCGEDFSSVVCYVKQC